MFLGGSGLDLKRSLFRQVIKRAGEIYARVKVRTGHARRGEH